MSPAACAGSPPRPRSESSGTAELLCPACGCGLVVAGQVEHGTSSAFVGVQLGRILGLKVVDPEAVFYGALVRDVGCGACGALLALVVHRPRTGASAGATASRQRLRKTSGRKVHR